LLRKLSFLLRENPRLLVGGGIVLLLFIACLIGFFYPYETALAYGKAPRNLGPSFSYWLGTDDTGQSILTLLIKGTESFFLPGLFATAVALFGGLLLGSLAGYYGGWFAHVGRYISALINSFPNLILILLCQTVFGTNMTMLAGLVGLTFVPHISDEIKRKVAQLKAEEFILAAEAHGLKDLSILFYHIVWLHCFSLVCRQIVYLWGYLIILETSLNYIGGGVLQSGFSWGKMLFDYRSGLIYGKYYQPLVVTVVIMFTMTGVYLLAEGLLRWNKGEGAYFEEEQKESA